MRPKTPISTALIINLVMTLLIAGLAGITAFGAINSAVEQAAREDISRDISVMLDRAPERGIVPDIAVLTSSVGKRIFAETNGNGSSVYFLATASGEKIVGNAERLPQPTLQGWAELDGVDIGVHPGPILVRVVTIDPDQVLIVGRRLTARAALNRWLPPVLAGGVILLGLCSSLLLGHLEHGFRIRIQQINSVFRRVETGDLAARVSPGADQTANDDLSVLTGNVNKALAEVERLMRGLESYSQVAAHELNHSISILRDRIIDAGEPAIAKQADRLIELVTHILELAKIEATPGFAMQKICLSDVVQSAISLYADAFEEASIRLESSFESEETKIFGSRPLIESALINLVSNALKHAPAQTRVTVRVAQDERTVSLSVIDEGSGVSSTRLGDLAANGQTGASGGHGFGLRHVEAVAIRHGARLLLENAEPGLRATLIFQMPEIA